VLPTHIPVTIEPIAGPPSDKQVQRVQTALRLSEDLVNSMLTHSYFSDWKWLMVVKVPSMYDGDLSMKLSQHLFDIQFGRFNLAPEVPPKSTE
jgi:hypothetical protein